MKRTIQLAESASMHRLSVAEAVDPKLFGELRSLLASPHKGLRQGKTFLRHVAEMLSRAYEQDADEADEVLLPYAVQAVSRLPDDQRWISAPADFDAIMFAPLRKRQKITDGAAAFMEQMHTALYQSSYTERISLDGLTASDMRRVRIGKSKTPNDGFAFEIKVSDFLDELALVRQALDLVAEGHDKAIINATGQITATSVSGFIHSLGPAVPPTIEQVTIRLHVSGMSVMQRRTGASPLGTILDRVAQRPSALQTLKNRTKFEFILDDYTLSAEDFDAVYDYQQTGILSGYFISNTNVELSF